MSGEVRADLLAGAIAGRAARLLRVVSAMVEETRPGRAGRVSLSSHLERDLGLDSLARVELLLRVGSEFGKSLPDAALAEAETPHDLLRFIDRAGGEGVATAAGRSRRRPPA
jgi:acyl carrier protein